jgi:hypothetical protein
MISSEVRSILLAICLRIGLEYSEYPGSASTGRFKLTNTCAGEKVTMVDCPLTIDCP